VTLVDALRGPTADERGRAKEVNRRNSRAGREELGDPRAELLIHAVIIAKPSAAESARTVTLHAGTRLAAYGILAPTVRSVCRFN
jgi:hypothetical protein